jgi:hypothetical protein
MHDTYYLLIMVTRAAFLLQVSHTTILGWSRTLKETGMRALLQKQVLVKTLLSAMVEKRPLDCFKESDAIIVVIAGVSVSHQLARVILETRDTFIQNQSWFTKTAIFHRDRSDNMHGTSRFV